MQQPRRGRGRAGKKTKAAPELTRIDEEPSSATWIASSPPRSPPQSLPFEVDLRIYEVISYLNNAPMIQIHLPDIGSPYDANVEEPWSAKFLTQLYIVAYNGGQWNVCDLVVDTWIRVFHGIRRRAEHSGNLEAHIWRINDALMRRRCQGKEGYDEKAPTYGAKMHVEDPELADDVHDFHRDVLAHLYNHTKPGAGARLLWADCMALCGPKLEEKMTKGKLYGQSWHPDLMYDILCTTLRMVGKKLTLKVEEGTEGAWCKRYHEHSKYGLPCYRKLAAEQRAEPTQGAGRGEKRGYDGTNDGEDGDEDDHGAKRTRYGYEDREVTDLDAEGEPDSE